MALNALYQEMTKIPLWTGQREDVWLLPPWHIDDICKGMPATIVNYARFDDSGNISHNFSVSINPKVTIPATIDSIRDHGADFIAIREDQDAASKVAFLFGVNSKRRYLSRVDTCGIGNEFSTISCPTERVLLFIGERIHSPGELIAKSGAFPSWPPVGEKRKRR